MAITFTPSTRTGASIAKPTSLADGEMVVISSNGFGTTTISGFTQLIDQVGGTTQSTRMRVFYKKNVVAASEPANYTLSGGSSFDSVIARVSGYDTTTPFGTPVGQAENGAGSTYLPPAYTPGVDDELLLHLLAMWDDVTSLTPTSGYTGLLSRVAQDDAYIEYKQLVGQNGISQGAGSITGAATKQSAQVTVGIRPAAGGATTVSRTATLTGTGSLTASRAITKNRTATAAGTSTLTATAARTRFRSASLTGVSSLTAAPTVTPAGGAVSRSATLSGVGGLTATRIITKARTGSLGATGGLTAARTITKTRTATMSGAGSLTATATVGAAGTVVRTASLSGTSTIAVGVAVSAHRRNLALSSTSTLTAVPTVRRTVSRTASLSGTGSLTAVGSIRRTVTRTASLAGASSLGAHYDAPIVTVGTFTMQVKPPHRVEPPVKFYGKPRPPRAVVRPRPPRIRF